MIATPKRLEYLTPEETKRLLDAIAREIESALPPEALFALLVFDNSGVARYVSNGDREGMVEALRESVESLEGDDG